MSAAAGVFPQVLRDKRLGVELALLSTRSLIHSEVERSASRGNSRFFPGWMASDLGWIALAQGVSVEKKRTYASRRRAYSSRHHGWRAPPEAIFFPARPLATIQTLAKWPKTRGLELAQNRPFLAGHLIFYVRPIFASLAERLANQLARPLTGK